MGQVRDKVGAPGPGKHQKQGIHVLNCILRWTIEVLEHQPDQTHSEIIVQEIDGHGGGKAHGSLGIVEACEEVEQYAESPEMSGSDGTAYRGLVSRLNYLDLDSPIM